MDGKSCAGNLYFRAGIAARNFIDGKVLNTTLSYTCFEMVEHKHVMVLFGFLILLSFFTALFLYDPSPSLTGYVIIDGVTRVSTEKLDPALVKEINAGNSEPRVIVILDNSTSSTEQVQKEIITSLQNDLVIGKINENQIGETDAAVSHTFDTINAIALEINNPKVLVELTKEKKVRQIILDYPVETTLDTSNPQIRSPQLWNTIINNMNLTGKGQTVCVIDTGIDYTHPALGGCNPRRYNITGTPENLSVPIESSHPYNDSVDITWIIQKEGFSSIALHFTNITLEAQNGGSDTLDRIYVYNQHNQTIAIYKGTQNDVWTPHAEGDTLYVRLVTDGSLTDFGFRIDQVVNGTTNTTMDWSNCSVLVGGWDTYNSDADPMDDHGHGTHVAGIIASRNETYRGVAPESTLATVKALNSNGGGYSSDVVAGIEWCNKNAQRLNISVISMSLGCGGASCVHFTEHCEQDLTSLAINDSYNRNISVFIASGNNGWSDGISNPSCVKKAIPVGGLSETNTTVYNRGTLLRILAPAINIRSTTIGGGWTTLSGTSMAAPNAAAVAVLMQQYNQITLNKQKTVEDIEQKLGTRGLRIYDNSSSLFFTTLDAVNATLPTLYFTNDTLSTNSTIKQNIIPIIIESEIPLANVALQWFYPNSSTETIIITGKNSTLFALNKSLLIGLHSYYAFGFDISNFTLYTENRTVIRRDELTITTTLSNNSNQSNTLEFNLTINVTSNATVEVNLTNGTVISNIINTSFAAGEYELPYFFNLTNYSNGQYYIITQLSTAMIEIMNNYTIFINNSNSDVQIPIVNENQTSVIVFSEPLNNSTLELGTNTLVRAIINLSGNYSYVWYTNESILNQNTTNSSELMYIFNTTAPANSTLFLNVTQGASYQNSLFLITLDTTPPELTGISFNNPHHRGLHGQVQINATLKDVGGLQEVAIIMLGTRSAEGCLNDGYTAVCSWTIPDLTAGEYPFNINATDLAGHNYQSNQTIIVTDCADAILNGDETEIDCGGSCTPCVPAIQQAEVEAPVLTQEVEEEIIVPESTKINYTTNIKEERQEKQEFTLFILGGLVFILSVIAFILHRPKS